MRLPASLGPLLALVPFLEAPPAVAGPEPMLAGRLELAARGVSVGGARAPARQGVAAFVQSRDPQRTRARVVALGGRVTTIAGDILTVRLPTTALRPLAGEPHVVRLEASRSVAPRLDQVRALLGVDALHRGAAPLNGRYTGRGVLVGVVDLSLDLSHPAIDRQRLVAFWDQDGTKAPPAGFDYGTVCDRASLVAGTCRSFVYDGHGTHVTTIAAGSRVGGLPYYGIAFGSDIGFVNLGGEVPEGERFESWLTTSVCDAVSFLFGVAADRGTPAVVNLSLGTHAGPHDGSTLAERCLDNLVGPGRIIVAAAGNEGGYGYHAPTEQLTAVHAQGTAGTTPLTLSLGLGEPTGEGESFQIWFEAGAPAAAARLGIRPAQGDIVWSEPYQLGEGPLTTTLTVDGVTYGPLEILSDEAPSGDRAFELTVHDQDEDLAEGNVEWVLELQGTGPFDGYLDINSGGGFFVPEAEGELVIDGTSSIGYPAIASGVIAVGSAVSRQTWRSAAGKTEEALDYLTGEPVEVGQLSSFSSRGPTRDLAVTGPKPDFVAPGEMVISALPAVSLRDAEPETIVRNPPQAYYAAAGTSQASPAAAGVIALWLERDPSLTPERVRALVADTASAPAGEPLPSPDFGYGLLDAEAALRLVPEINPGEPPPPPRDDEGGCGCSTPRAHPTPWWLALSLLIPWLRRRRH